MPTGAVGERLGFRAVQHRRAAAVEVVGGDVHPTARRIRLWDRVVVTADLRLSATLVVPIALRLRHGRPITLCWIGFHQSRRLRHQVLDRGDEQVVLPVDLHHPGGQLRHASRCRLGQQWLQVAGDPVVAHTRHVVDRIGIDVQRDRRMPGAEADPLAREAVATDLQDAAGKLHELTQVGRADVVITCRRSGSGGGPDADRLTGRQRRQDGLRDGSRRIGVRDGQRQRYGAKQRRGCRPDHSSAASSSAI